MRRVTASLSLVLLAVLAMPAQATEVALLDWRRALMQTDAAGQSMNELQGRIGGQQQQAESLAQELEQMQRRLQDEGERMSEGDRQAAMQEFQQKGARFQQLRQQVLQAQQQAEQTFLQQAEPKLEQAVDQVIERHGVEVLVDPQGVLHSDLDLPDLTEEVTQILNSLL